jgi:glucose-6-phosphate isomerase
MHIRSFGGVVTSPEIIAGKSYSLDNAIRRLQAVNESGRYDDDESSINLPGDEMVVTAAEHVAQHFRSAVLRHVFLVGIGGSNLGTKAVIDALFSWQLLPVAVHIVDTVHTERIQGLVSIIENLASLEECLLISISKSGGTTETLANTELLLAAMRSKDAQHYAQRVVVITDTDSSYSRAAEEKGIAVLAMPPKVGGRFSVFSTVGMFPLALLGVDIRAMRQGAVDMIRLCTNFDSTVNPAVMTAILQHEAYEAGYNSHTLFAFADELESLGKWWRQLVGESLAKTTRTTKKPVGVIPTVSIGSTDLHSVGQLYLGGPATTLTTFLSIDQHTEMRLPKTTNRAFSTIVPAISDIPVTKINTAIIEGTKRAYEKKGLPYIDLVLSHRSPYEIGAFMQYAMCATMYTAELFDVHAFNQPEVELYKIETKHILEAGAQQ